MAKKAKYYVVWQGVEPGIYRSWTECEAQVKGFAGAVYKSFDTEEEAEEAFYSSPTVYIAHPQSSHEGRGRGNKAERSNEVACGDEKAASPDATPRSVSVDKCVAPPDYRHDTVLPLPPEVEANALAVDAACSGNPGRMEYRGIYLKTGQIVFHFGPAFATNNIGEFLAIVHAIGLLKKQGTPLTIYSDSRNALLWVRARKCKTQLARTSRTEPIYQLIERAEKFLAANGTAGCTLKKWETSRWGEIPADFGRK